MDYVITYVDSTDREWQRGCSYSKMQIQSCRFRDIGTLKYHLRCVENNLSFIDRVILIVSSYSQVPTWINTKYVKVVTHKDFMPDVLLPTYNSSTIEPFLCNISELSNKFIYANDDMFVLKKLEENNFFQDDKIVMKYGPITDRLTPYFRKLCINSYEFITQDKSIVIKPDHFLSPIIKEHGLLITKDKDIISLCTKYRWGNEKTININQYIFTNYEYVIGNYTTERYPIGKYRNLNDVTEEDFENCEVLCINDNHQDIKEGQVSLILNQFEKLFPNKSRYEK